MCNNIDMIFETLFSTGQFLLILLSIFILGGILFTLTGIIHVKKGRIAIIERIGEFKGIYKAGFYYFAPLLYKRAGMYRLGNIEETYLIDKTNYKITYEITDVKKFHYDGKHDVEGILTASIKNNKDNLSKTLIKRFESVGVRFIKLEKLLK